MKTFCSIVLVITSMDCRCLFFDADFSNSFYMYHCSLNDHGNIKFNAIQLGKWIKRMKLTVKKWKWNLILKKSIGQDQVRWTKDLLSKLCLGSTIWSSRLAESRAWAKIFSWFMICRYFQNLWICQSVNLPSPPCFWFELS